MGKQVQDLSAEAFGDAIGQGITVVDFWAPWCEPCKEQSPIVEEVAQTVDDNVHVARLNVDDASDVATKHHVRSVPSVLVFKDGSEVKRLTGVHDKEALVKAIEEAS